MHKNIRGDLCIFAFCSLNNELLGGQNYKKGVFKMTDYESPEVSDLAVERRKADTDIPGVKYRRERTVGGVWERIGITSDEGARSIP